MTTYPKVRCGLIGVRHGHIVSALKTGIKEGLLEVVGVSDSDPELRQRYAQEFAAKAFPSYNDILDDGQIEAVALAPVNSEKGDLLCAALAAGKHVLIDKPLVTGSGDLLRVEQQLCSSKRVLTLLLGVRTDPTIATARRLVAQGVIGDLVYCTFSRSLKLRPSTRPPWQLDDAISGGLIADIGIHDIDLFRWVTQATADQISVVAAAQSNRRFGRITRFYDNAQYMLKAHHRVMGLFDISWLTPDASRYHSDPHMRWIGTSGAIYIRSTEGRLEVETNDCGTISLELDRPRHLVADFIYGIHEGVDKMYLPPQEAIASTRLALMVKEAAAAV